jgi:hypothetical protein
VRLQYGRVVARYGAQDIDPYCLFELDTVAPAPQRVQPEAFQVTGVERLEELFSSLPASVRLARAGGFRHDDGPGQRYLKTRFRLRGAAQPQVRALTCQHNVAFETLPRHLTLTEMRQAVGDYFRFELSP